MPVTLRLVSQTPWNTLKDPDARHRDPGRQRRRVADRRPDARRHHRRGRPLTDGVRDVARVGAPNCRSSPPRFPRTTRSSQVGRGGSVRPWTCPTIGGISRTDSLVYPMRIDLRSGGVPGRRRRYGGRSSWSATPRSRSWSSTTIELTAPLGARSGRAAGRPRLRGIRCAGWLPFGARGLRARPAGARNSGSAPSIWSSNRRCSINSPGWPTATSARTAARVKEGEGGAARAAALLTELRQRWSSSALIHVTAMPFSAPTIPSLLASGLSTDLATQQAAGRDSCSQSSGSSRARRSCALRKGRWTTRR